jgi:hypothetical protein
MLCFSATRSAQRRACVATMLPYIWPSWWQCLKIKNQASLCYANIIFCFYWSILLICTGFNNDLFYLAKHRNERNTDEQAKIDLLGDCRHFGWVRDESRRRVPQCVRGLSNICSDCHVCFLQFIILSSNCSNCHVARKLCLLYVQHSVTVTSSLYRHTLILFVIHNALIYN